MSDRVYCQAARSDAAAVRPVGGISEAVSITTAGGRAAFGRGFDTALERDFLADCVTAVLFLGAEADPIFETVDCFLRLVGFLFFAIIYNISGLPRVSIIIRLTHNGYPNLSG